MIKIAIPSKGRLAEPTLRLLEEAGLRVIANSERMLFAKCVRPGIEYLFMRAADIPEYVQEGAVDMGISGLDLVEETGAKVKVMQELDYGQCSLVLAVPERSKIRSKRGLKGKRIATMFPNLTKKYLKGTEIVRVSGSTEVAPYLGIAEGIVDLTSSGTTLKINKLRVVETFMGSRACVICRRGEKREGVANVSSAIKSVAEARGKKYLMANVERENLEAVRRIMPGMGGPTIMQILGEEEFFAVHSVVDEHVVFDVVKKLKKAGAKDILVTPIERIIP